MSQHTPEPQRLRLTFRKGEAVKYVGHLDMVRAWERALRRSGLPLAYSEGFNPQAKLQFASALPVGATGRQELVDVILEEAMACEDFLAAVKPQLPAGLELLAAQPAPLKGKALQGRLRGSIWQIDVQTEQPDHETAGRIAWLLEQEDLPASRERKGRTLTYDLRPLVLDLSWCGQPEPGWQRLLMTLRSEPGATGRPDAVLAALGLAGRPFRMERTECIFADEVATIAGDIE